MVKTPKVFKILRYLKSYILIKISFSSVSGKENFRARTDNNYYELHANDVVKAVNKLLSTDGFEKITDKLVSTAAKIYRKFNQQQN